MSENTSQHKPTSPFLAFLSKLVLLDTIEVLKMIVGGVMYFCVIFAYTIAQEIKYGVFSTIVGASYIPMAKIIVFIVLLPAILLDGYLVDRFKRYQIAILYFFIFGVLGVIFSLLFIHPEIGLYNTVQDPHRLFGWLFFIYVESYFPFLLGIFWAFINSIHKPEHAKRTYAYIISFSKVGGFLAAFLGYLFLLYFKPSSFSLDDPTKLHVLLLTASIALLFMSTFLIISLRKMDRMVFTGYRTELTQEEQGKKTGVLAGLKVFFTNRYVFCIFLLIFLGDIIAEMVNYKRILLTIQTKAQKSGGSGGSLGILVAELYKQLSLMHATGLLVSIVFTNYVMRFFTIRFCVFIMPVLTLTLLLAYMITGTAQFVIWLYIIIKATYYTIGVPIRESLYIITDKDIQFKSKFVVDAFGLKIGRGAGQIFNHMINVINKNYGLALSVLTTNLLFIGIPILWIFAAYYVGTVYTKAIQEKELIKYQK